MFLKIFLNQELTTLAESVVKRGFSEILWKEDTAGHYRHMTSGNFLVSLTETEFFEGKIIKLKSLLEENIAWNQTLTMNKDLSEDKIATIDNKIMNISTS